MPSPWIASASQISSFRECARKWAWRSLAKVVTPQHPAAALGTEVDDEQLQPFLRDGREFDYTRPSGHIANSARQYLPKHGTPGLEVQRHFLMPSPSGPWKYQGYLDVWLPYGDVPGVPTVIDFKTTSDLKWAKSPETLAVDVQAQLYAMWALWETRAPAVDLVWIYMQTRGAHRVRKVSLRAEAEAVAVQFAEIEETAQHMAALRDLVEDPRDLPPSVDQCESYGGCPYRDRCSLSPGEIVSAGYQLKGNLVSKENLIANLRAKRAAAQPAPTPAPAATEPAPAPALPAWAESKVPYTGPMTAHPDPSVSAAASSVVGKDAQGLNVYGFESKGINPPESALPPAAPVQVGGSSVTSGQPAKADTQQPAPEAPVEAKRPGRPPGAKNRPKDAPPVDEPAGGATVTVTWGEERYSPVPYQSFVVGPFSMTGHVRAGETSAEAARRLYAELAEFAGCIRDEKALSFRTALEGK